MHQSTNIEILIKSIPIFDSHGIVQTWRKPDYIAADISKAIQDAGLSQDDKDIITYVEGDFVQVVVTI